MGGATPMQHRVSNGCFVSKLGSSGWSPGSSGRARINGGGNGKMVSTSSPLGNPSGVFMLLIKLALLALTYAKLKNFCKTSVLHLNLENGIKKQVDYDTIYLFKIVPLNSTVQRGLS